MPEEKTTGQQDTSGGDGDRKSPGDNGQPSSSGKHTDEDLQRAVDQVVGRERARYDRLERSIQKRIDDAIASWRDERGLDDAAIERLAGNDQASNELRKLKSDLTKSRNELAQTTDRATRMSARLRDALTRDAILRAAEAAGAVSSEQVWYMLRDNLTIDESDGDYRVMAQKDGKPAADLTIEKLVKQLLADQPNLARPKGIAGAGSRGTIGQSVAAGEPDLATPEGRRLYLRAHMAKLSE